MPALIVFGSSGAEQSKKTDSVRVAQDAEAVVKELAGANGSFAALDLPKDRGKVWVNRDLVRMVRDVGGKE